jgi:putative solute:sodium symporter small subunit
MVNLPPPGHWRLRAVLLLVWGAVSFGVCYHARALQFSVNGWPFGYWMAAQGALLVFIAVVVVYATVLNRAERRAAAAAAP